MDYLDFEKGLKDKLSQSRKEVDMNRLLNDLNIHNEKPSRFIPGFLSTSALLIAFLSIAYFSYTNYFSEKSTSVAHTIQANEASKAVEIDKSQLSIEANVSSEASIIAQSKKAQNKIIEVEQQESSQKIIEAKTAKSIIDQTNPQINTNSYFKGIGIDQASESVLNPKKNLNNSTAKHFSIPAENKIILSPKNQTTSKELDKSTKSAEIIADINAKPLETIKENSQVWNSKIEAIPSLSLITLQTNETQSASFLPLLKDCPTFKDRLWTFSFIPEIGYQWPIKKLETDDANAAGLLEERKQDEITLESFQAAAYFELKHNSGLYLKPGISISKTNEQFKLKNNITISDTTLQLVRIDTIIVNDTIEITQIYEEKISDSTFVNTINSTYSISQVDIPISIGYTHLLEGFAIDFEIGAKFNILTRTSGSLYIGDEPAFARLRDDETYFRRSVGLGFFGGINIRKQLNAFGEVYLAPRFQFNTKTISSDGNAISQKYSNFGLHLGYVYTFATK